MKVVEVCTGKWYGKRKEQFEWHNPDQKNDATIEKFGEWPFTLPSKIIVPAGAKLQCGLKDKAGSYEYNVNPCKMLGNPKTVVIG